MQPKKKEHPKEKARLHRRNKHRERYDLKLLSGTCPELAPYVKINQYGDESIDFFDPEAVRYLNTALLKHNYNIKNWSIPTDYLCPAVPGRADYIHYLADLLNSGYLETQNSPLPAGNKIKCLDIGTGANCIYPIIGNAEYGWEFVGTDIDPVALEAAKEIVRSNPNLEGKIELRLQSNPKNIFYDIIQKGEYYDLTICNPPFHVSAADAQDAAAKKIKNLKGKNAAKPVLNFGGQMNELWCKGGEARFITDMIIQSKQFPSSCFWYSTLVSKQENLEGIYLTLDKEKALEVKTIKMGTGNKISRIVAWTFLSKEQQKVWKQHKLKTNI